jgi:hypothetical protein
VAAVLFGHTVSVHAAPASGSKAKDDDTAALLGQAPAKVSEVERGVWVAVEAAPVAHVDWITTLPPTRLPRQLFPDDGGFGIRMATRLGVDILGLVSLDGYMVSHFRDKRVRRGRSFTGDLTDVNMGLGVRLMPITIKKRLSFSGRLGLGLAGLFPGEVARANANPTCMLPPAKITLSELNPLCVALPGIATPENPVGFVPFPSTVLAFSPSAEGMLSVEYFTALRHFSVGADFVTGAVLWPLSVHVGVVPHIKYTF